MILIAHNKPQNWTRQLYHTEVDKEVDDCALFEQTVGEARKVGILMRPNVPQVPEKMNMIIVLTRMEIMVFVFDECFSRWLGLI